MGFDKDDLAVALKKEAEEPVAEKSFGKPDVLYPPTGEDFVDAGLWNGCKGNSAVVLGVTEIKKNMAILKVDIVENVDELRLTNRLAFLELFLKAQVLKQLCYITKMVQIFRSIPLVTSCARALSRHA